MGGYKRRLVGWLDPQQGGASGLGVGGGRLALLRFEMRHVVECISHLSIAIGRILAEWVQAEGKDLAPIQQIRL